MTDRPILFSAPMVRALLEGRKTQTRRVLRPQPGPFDALFSDAGKWWTGDAESGEVHEVLRVPYAIGDRLWVREAFSVVFGGGMSVSGDGEWDYIVEYRSGGQIELSYDGHYDSDPYSRLADTQIGDWRPSIHMPRWASRLTLIVTDVRVQRLRDISEADARAEGICADIAVTDAHNHWVDLGGGDLITGWDARDVYASLWNYINGAGAWHSNPWVMAISFRTIRANIDSAEAAA